MSADYSLPDCHEGPEASDRFDSMVEFLLAVPRSLLERRQRAYLKKVDANPNRRGPKRKSEQAEELPAIDALPEEA
jgi:hypothetical protein